MELSDLAYQIQKLAQDARTGIATVTTWQDEIRITDITGETFIVRRMAMSVTGNEGGTYQVSIKAPAGFQKPIQAIKEVRAITSLGLKEAKDIVDQSKCRWARVLTGVSGGRAINCRAALEATGLLVEIEDVLPATPEQIETAKEVLLITEKQLTSQTNKERS